MNIPCFSDVEAAAKRISGYVTRTPLIQSPVLDELIGAKVLIKAENLQWTGSFKLRGAFNRILSMPLPDRKKGVVAWSAGNHGQSLAYAGRMLGVPITIVMPSDAPRAKIDGTKRWGAEIVLFDRRSESREEIGYRIAGMTGAVVVPPFDDPDIIAGQGTACLEALEDARLAGFKPTVVLCPTGGGGLVAGCALAVEGSPYRIAVHSVEPAGIDDTARSLIEGKIVSNPPGLQSICDALITIAPGEIPFSINSTRLSRGLTVSDSQVCQAMRIAVEELKIVAEPGGAVALAAALFHCDLVRGQTVVIMVSGGNLNLSTLAKVLKADTV